MTTNGRYLHATHQLLIQVKEIKVSMSWDIGWPHCHIKDLTLLPDLFLYSYENELLDNLIKEGKKKLVRKFSLSYHYIDDLISFNNKRFNEFISDIYPKELRIYFSCFLPRLTFY